MRDSILNFDNLEDYFDFLCEHKLTPEQFAFLYLLLIDEKNNKGRFKETAKLYKYSKEGPGWTQECIDDLEKRGFIKNYNRYSGSEKKTIPDYYEITETFKRLLVEPPSKVGEELWRRYPSWITINEKQVPAKNIDKDELINKYHRVIQGSLRQHKKVMKALEYQKRYGLVNMGIDKYVGSRQWESVLDKISDDESDGWVEEEVKYL